MIDDMTARRLSEKVRKAYVRHARTFAARRRGRTFAPFNCIWRSNRSAQGLNAAIATLRFIFNVTLERPDLVRPLTTVNKPVPGARVIAPKNG
jgi:integrase/recombinase XerD